MNHLNEKHSLDNSTQGLSDENRSLLLLEVNSAKDIIAHYASDAEFDPEVHAGLSDSEKANFADTPIRAAKAIVELNREPHLHQGVLSDRRWLTDNLKAKYRYYDAVRSIIETGFPTEGEDCGIVTQGSIAARGLCPHHLLPVYYEVFVAYKPDVGGHVLGLSKLARVVQELAARPVLQEQLTADIADVFCRPGNRPTGSLFLPGIKSDGSAVQMVGQHTCMSCRGVKSQAATLTTVLRGSFAQNAELKSEFYQAILAIKNMKF